MRSFLRWTAPVGALFVSAVVADCGGNTTSPSGGSDASTDSASSSSGGSGGSSGGSSSGSSSGSTSSSGSSSGGTGNCPACTSPGMMCCNGVDCTVDSLNDPDHCGACNVVCQGATPFCQQGKCVPTPCDSDSGDPLCCGTTACATGEVCCEFEGPQDYAGCYAYDGGGPRCPPGCPSCVSDRNVKRDIEPVDPQAVLEGLARVPVATWSYKSDDPSVRHMGPMAQDFYGEFGLGNTDRAYSPIDAHGVAFAAIQALYERVQEQEARIEQLERENAELSRRAASPRAGNAGR
jgi:hypothetical protein